MTLNPGDFSINTCSKSSTTGNQYSTVLTGSDLETFQNNALESIVNIMRNVSDPAYEIPGVFALNYIAEVPGSYTITMTDGDGSVTGGTFTDAVLTINVAAGTWQLSGPTSLGPSPFGTGSGVLSGVFLYSVNWTGDIFTFTIDKAVPFANVRTVSFDYRAPLDNFSTFSSGLTSSAGIIFNDSTGSPAYDGVTTYLNYDQAGGSVNGLINATITIGRDANPSPPVAGIEANPGVIIIDFPSYQAEYTDEGNIIYDPVYTIQPTQTFFYDVLRGAPVTGPGPEITDSTQLRYLKFIANELFGPLRNAAKAISSVSTSAVCDDTEENGRYQVCVSNCLFTMNIIVQ